MTHNANRPTCLLVALLAVALAKPLFAHGDKVIPQVADGATPDGQVFRTKFDITNLGPEETTRIRNVTVRFYQPDGSPWTIATNQGTTSQITLDLGAFQTIRIETLGAGSLATGYAIVQNLENTTIFAEDYDVAITAYYEVRKGNVTTETISVPVGQPTVVWVFPAETDLSRELLTGFAIANLANTSNTITLRLWSATTPTSGSASDAGTATFVLNPNQQQARFLNQAGLFPGVSNFRGMVLGTSEKPVSILALLQTPSTPPDKQYATLVPAYADALRRNTAMYLRQGLPLDADIPVSDYFGNKDDSAPWDILYETGMSSTERRLAPKNGAGLAIIGQRSDVQFDDDVNITYLRGLTHTSSNIDLSDGSANLQSGFTFGVRTALGRYVKIRIREVIERGADRDLALEIYVYK